MSTEGEGGRGRTAAAAVWGPRGGVVSRRHVGHPWLLPTDGRGRRFGWVHMSKGERGTEGGWRREGGGGAAMETEQGHGARQSWLR